MIILSIDPGSDKAEQSTTGIVLLDNAKLLDYWVVPNGAKGFRKWFEENLPGHDVAVIEKFEARDNGIAKDNTVLDVIATITMLLPNAILQRNAGYCSDVPNELLKALGLYKFKKSHHQDVRAAARLGLFWAIRNDIEEVVMELHSMKKDP